MEADGPLASFTVTERCSAPALEQAGNIGANQTPRGLPSSLGARLRTGQEVGLVGYGGIGIGWLSSWPRERWGRAARTRRDWCAHIFGAANGSCPCCRLFCALLPSLAWWLQGACCVAGGGKSPHAELLYAFRVCMSYTRTMQAYCPNTCRHARTRHSTSLQRNARRTGGGAHIYTQTLDRMRPFLLIHQSVLYVCASVTAWTRARVIQTCGFFRHVQTICMSTRTSCPLYVCSLGQQLASARFFVDIDYGECRK